MLYMEKGQGIIDSDIGKVDALYARANCHHLTVNKGC